MDNIFRSFIATHPVRVLRRGDSVTWLSSSEILLISSASSPENQLVSSSCMAGWLGSISRSDVMLVPPYLKSSRSRVCRSCEICNELSMLSGAIRGRVLGEVKKQEAIRIIKTQEATKRRETVKLTKMQEVRVGLPQRRSNHKSIHNRKSKNGPVKCTGVF